MFWTKLINPSCLGRNYSPLSFSQVISTSPPRVGNNGELDLRISGQIIKITSLSFRPLLHIYTLQCTLYIVHCTLYIVHCTELQLLGIENVQTNRQTKHICMYRNSILVTVCTQPLYLCTGSTAKTITMYSNILFMYRKYSANYHDVLKYWIYVHEVLQRKLSPCTQPLYLFTGSSAQTIAMYSTIVFMYGRCYSANYRHVLNHVFIYVHVLQRKPSLYTLKLYLFTRSTAQTLAIVFMHRRCYSANYHYVLNHCIYVQEVLQGKLSLCI